MKINKSPWIHQLNQDRKTLSLTHDNETDVAIVGAGIAGISTTFFILRHTNKRVVLIDKSKLAHGATGHNAGQVVGAFERPLDELVQEFGFDLVKEALHDLHGAWRLIDEMYTEANLNILFSRTTRSRGFSNSHQVLLALKDLEIEILSGLPQNEFLISESAPFLEVVPSSLKHLYRLVPHEEVLKKLDTEDVEFHAVVSDQAACVNSALFCQEIVEYLLKKYSDRFVLYENTDIRKVVLKKDFGLLDAGKHTIHAERIVLCTNGFEGFDIFNDGGLAIDKKFHHTVMGKVGYMSGYLESVNKPPTALAYFVDDSDPSQDDPYFYLTRRPHGSEDEKHNLVCVGGPEIAIEDRQEYIYDYDYPEKMHQDIDAFIRRTHYNDSEKKITYEFTWHGLMGYTPNRVRVIGSEPKNEVLLYNLGCNGIGILPSIYGGKRISKILGGQKLRPSIFDPKK
jgi:glycine/D-amino acid oxidase-like deaminating enzyme